ncbi:Hypothetical predicted protein [Paramuricea clavata]|uniref:Uncharacterized protein n=1 Tax=Paramuricea clavata TaxID=317549 RepID=A0A7D9JFD9_PARCT|nr:Hypothetical predicted protein [Paramuricea clavata]
MEEVEIQNKTDKSRVLNEDEHAFTSQQNFTKGETKYCRFSLKYVGLKQPWKLVVYCNASYANLKDGSSQGGMIIFLVDRERRASPINLDIQKVEESLQKHNCSINNVTVGCSGHISVAISFIG